MKALYPCALMSLCALMPAKAQTGLVVTYAEDPGSFRSTLSHTSVFDFNGLSTGKNTQVAWNGVGSYDQLTIKTADQYGGAGDPQGSNYAVQGAGGVTVTTLTLTDDHSYFGFWWSAGDSQNVLAFYSGDLLVARFTTASLLNQIASSPDYYGNPTSGSRAGMNSGEPYAFVNFFGIGETSWDRIVFTNGGSSGFESDNHTDRDLGWGGYPEELGKPLPGVAVAEVRGNEVTMVPEPSSLLLASLAAVAGIGRRRR